jgi:drug/metabolite transporter (DMT)-like permease
MKTKARQTAMLMMAACAVLWSLGGNFIKLISWHPLLISGGRSLIAAAVVGLYMAWKKIPVKVCRYSVAAGISLCLCLLFFVVANKLTTAANAIVLQYTAPIFILLVNALFFGQKLRKKEVLAVLGTMAGTVLFFLDQLSPGNLLGNLLAILAGMFLGVGSLLLLSRSMSAIASSGSTYSFDCITACVLGGVMLGGGRGKVYQCVMGVLVVNVIFNGLTIFGINDFVRQVITGLVLVFAIAMEVLQSNAKVDLSDDTAGGRDAEKKNKKAVEAPK